MIDNQTIEQLRSLRLDGMLAAISDPATAIATSELSFDQRLSLLVQREVDWRDGKRLTRLIKNAQLKFSSAAMEDINWRATRGLDRTVMSDLASCDWVRRGRSVLLTGAAGCGKTWIACALARQAARQGFSVYYTRASRLLQELHVAHGDGSFTKRLTQLARLDVLLIDDLALSPITASERSDLLEILDDRVGTRATIIGSQVPHRDWHTWLNEPTIADAIMDRIVHGAYKIALKGKSLRDEDKADTQ